MTQEINLDQIKFDRHNANKGSVRGRGQIEASLREFGFADAGTLDKNNTIIGGNKRTEVAGEIGMDEAIIVDVDGTKPVFIRRKDLDLNSTEDDRARRLAYALNRSQEVSLTWDAEVLLTDLQSGVDLKGLFDQEELDALLDGLTEKEPMQPAEAQIDKAAELQKLWNTQPGQLWQLGRHRLICGDCTDKATVERLMQGERADMVFTDPPYNVAYQSNESVESLKARNRRTDGLIVQNDAMTDGEFDEFLDSFLTQMPLKDGGAYYLCAPPGYPETQFRNALDRVSGLALRECIVWVKDRFVFGRQDYHWRHESILYGWKEGASHYFVDDRTQDTVWEIQRPTVSEFHPTMKPVELPIKAIGNSSRDSEIIYEPFAGSGTTLIACEQLNRQCRAVEISPAYAAVILQRYKDSTNVEPVLIDTVTKQ
jgi:DNA modification methylase